MYLIFYDAADNNKISAHAYNGGADMIAHYASKFPGLTSAEIISLPDGFESGPMAKTSWKHNASTEAAELITA